jgi:hypothetical protein
MDEDKVRDAAYDFIKTLDVTPNDDAISQLSGPLAVALMIICERGYSTNPGAETWRLRGWKGMVHDILDKAYRLRFRSWFRSEFDSDSAIDLINFAGFYWRMRCEGAKWGELGEPG